MPCPCPPPKNGNHCSCDDYYGLNNNAENKVTSIEFLKGMVKVDKDPADYQEAESVKYMFRPNSDSEELQSAIKNELLVDYALITIAESEKLVLPFHLKSDGKKLVIIGPNMVKF